MAHPNYFIQRDDLVLCAYWRKDILQLDLAINKDVVQIFMRVDSHLTLQYRLITRAEFESLEVL